MQRPEAERGVSAGSDPWNGKERRAHRRSRPDQDVAVLFGRSWQHCEILDVSQGGVAIRSDRRPALGKEIIVRIAQLGLFKCRVLRHIPEGFAARFEAADFGREGWALAPTTDHPADAPDAERREDALRSGG